MLRVQQMLSSKHRQEMPTIHKKLRAVLDVHSEQEWQENGTAPEGDW